MSSPIQSARLPELIGPPHLLESPPRERWLDRVRACRLRLGTAWRQQHADRADQATAAIDRFLGLLLLIRFVRDRRTSILPAEVIGQPEGTPRTRCQGIWQALRSPLLKAVFDPTDFDDTEQIGETVGRIGAAIDLGWRGRAGRVVPLPPTAFGEFHQLCLAEQDAGKAGQRRARGVHYTPVSLADYLTSRVLDHVRESHPDRTPLRILDPSCGGGTFLLAAFRPLLQQQAGLSQQEILDMLGKSLFGIDIDPQAVIWTRRALLLAAWDALLAPNDEAADADFQVPDLRRNIICQDFLLTTLWRGTERHAEISVRELPATTFWRSDWSLNSATERSLLARLRDAGTPLGRLPVSIVQGVVNGADSVFLLRRIGSTQDGETLVQGRDRRQHLLLESPLMRPIVRNRDIQGYGRLSPRTMCLMPYDSSGRLLPEAVLSTRYPKAYHYLLRHRDALIRRRGVEPGAWYALRSASCLTLAAGPRVLLKLICSGGDFTIDCEGRYLGRAGTLMLLADQRQIDPFYLLGVLNSRVFWFLARHTMPTMGAGRHVLRRSTLRSFPLVISGPTQDARQQIADAVRGLLGASETLPERPRLPADIERPVAELYGIEPAELLAENPERQGADHA